MAINIVNGIIYDAFNAPMINVTVQAMIKTSVQHNSWAMQ